MKIHRCLLGILLLTGWSFSLPAQSTSDTDRGRDNPHTLLWRISGKEGHKTSYLYGTIHLTDERVFRLGDSLYEAIRHSDGLAIEIDPGAMVAYMMDEIKKELIGSKSVRDLLPENEYKRYAPLLERRFKKSSDKITSGDILLEKNKWIGQSYKGGKMTTFLDIWLYDIARRQNKWTGGIEDMMDQVGPNDNLIDPSDIRELLAEDSTRAGSRALTEEMILLYQRQDIDGIDSIVGSQNGPDPVLRRRNHKMAARMDSLSSLRSMVFAVGAAHLAGKEGLIRLLRDKGFDVQPVFSTRKIPAAAYKIPEMPVIWNEVRDEHGYYQASMPGVPSDIQLYGILDMKMYFDIFDGLGYFTMAARSAFSEEKTDSLSDMMARRIFQPKNIKEYVPFSLRGGKGRMYTVRDKEGLRKGFILSRKGIFYLALVNVVKTDPVNERQIDRFLKSFTILDIPDPPSDSVYAFSEPSLGFRVETPVKINKYKDPSVAAGGADSRVFMGADEREGIYYFFGVNRIAKGRYIDNDSTFLINLEKNLASKLTTITHDTTFLFEGRRVLEFQGPMKGADLMMRTRYINRGNRWYALLVMYPVSAPRARATRYFNSFSLLDYPAHPWISSFSPDSLFSTRTPSPLVIAAPDSSLSSVDRKYDSPDTITENNFSVVAYHLSSYFWALSDSAFWAQRLAGHISARDSLVYKKRVSNGAASGWEWIKFTRHSLIYQRIRLLLYGDELYSLFVSTPREEIQSPDVNRFFDDFRFTHPPPETHVFRSKADRLLTDLFSSDSTTATAACDYLGQAPFTRQDLPLLHRSLSRVTGLAGHPVGPERIRQTLQQKLISLEGKKEDDNQ